MKVFLGGTCNESKWRTVIIMLIHETNKLTYFNPVVDDWNEEAQENELRERENCHFCLYTITPKKIGDYAIAEVADDSNKRPDKTILVLQRTDESKRFSDAQWKSLIAVANLVKRNGGKAFYSLAEAVDYMNFKVDMFTEKKERE